MRDADGEFLVLEDNLRTPSGFAYALAAREALADIAAAGLPDARAGRSGIYELLGAALRAAAPGARPELCVVVLTDGPGNVAYYEHAQAGARLDAPLAHPRRPGRATATACGSGCPGGRRRRSTSSTAAPTRIASATSTAS